MNFDSFSGVSARLRERGLPPETVDAVLELLRARRAQQAVELDEFELLGLDRSGVIAVLNAIIDDELEDLLEVGTRVACPSCGTLEEVDLVRQALAAGREHLCTEDQTNLADPEAPAPEVPVYSRIV